MNALRYGGNVPAEGFLTCNHSGAAYQPYEELFYFT